MEKWNPTQEAINKALRPNTIRKWLNTFLIIVIGAGIIGLVIFFGGKKQTINPTPVKNNTENLTKSNTETKRNTTESETRSKVIAEDFSSYINTSITNTGGKTNVAVTIVDEKGNFSSAIASSIADVYKQTGNIGNTGLIRSSFLHKSGFQELFEGNSEIIEKLKLNNHADYVALGKVSFSIRKGTLVDATFICTVSLTMNIVSVNQKSLVKSFTLSASGNGATEEQAKEYAIEKIVNKYFTEYSSI